MQSEQYPVGIVPPMSTTTVSPARSTRSLAVWCGTRAIRAGGDDGEVGSAVPLGQDRLADVGGDLPLGTAGPQPAWHLRVHPVDGLTGLTQRRDLGRRLARAERAQRRAGKFLPCAGQRGGEPEHHQRPHPVGEPDRGRAAEPLRNQGVRIVGLLPRDQFQAQTSGRRRLRGRQLEPRHDKERVTGGRNGQARQPLQGVGVVPAYVPQVRPWREEQGVEPCPARRGRGVRQSLCRVQVV